MPYQYCCNTDKRGLTKKKKKKIVREFNLKVSECFLFSINFIGQPLFNFEKTINGSNMINKKITHKLNIEDYVSNVFV